MSATDILFCPFKMKALSLPNRIVMAPMSRAFALSPPRCKREADLPVWC